jgi:hypothetical protein
MAATNKRMISFFRDWFNPEYVRRAQLIARIRRSGVAWHPCATSYTIPKEGKISKEEWFSVPEGDFR